MNNSYPIISTIKRETTKKEITSNWELSVMKLLSDIWEELLSVTLTNDISNFRSDFNWMRKTMN